MLVAKRLYENLMVLVTDLFIHRHRLNSASNTNIKSIRQTVHLVPYEWVSRNND